MGSDLPGSRDRRPRHAAGKAKPRSAPSSASPHAPQAAPESGDARALAADLVNAVLLEGRSLTAALEDQRRRLADLRPLAAAQDLAYGTLRQYGRLDVTLRALLDKPLDPPGLAGHLLVGLHELEQGEAPDYAVVNETVRGAARLHAPARGLANAVLRNFQRRRAELQAQAARDPRAIWNFPAWWVARLRRQYPTQWQDWLRAANGHPPMTLRINPRKVSLADYLEQLRTAGLEATQTGDQALTLVRPVPVQRLPGFDAGLVSVQDLGAQYAAPLLDCTDGMRVLDACAAPGGKTGHLLELHDLDLTALDSEARRLDRVRQNLDRLGRNARLVRGDAGDPAAWWDGRPFQRILLDAPCTASGVVRRHPDGKWLKREEDIQQLASEQARLLDALWPLLAPGGTLLYATCSVFVEENRAQVAAFLQRHDDAREQAIALPGAASGQLPLTESHDAFFYALLVKT
ncbi:MAG TPA: 16S rRNA (cytosine(967)-C(5))-methyltransferase RsmB [Thiobacillaceae bacterium]|nr:16S rRNA (cytosine(967)-C(5))-methyltransferase RsmB [Thiobacillaceae bacterium]